MSQSSTAADRPGASLATCPPAGRCGLPRLALATVVVWFAFLLWLTLNYANPVTLNREQILRADAVVQARVTNRAGGEIQVTQVLSGNGPQNTVRLVNLNAANAQGDQEYLMPLQRWDAERWVIVPTRLPNLAPLVYPVGEESLAQLRALIPGAAPAASPPRSTTPRD